MLLGEIAAKLYAVDDAVAVPGGTFIELALSIGQLCHEHASHFRGHHQKQQTYLVDAGRSEASSGRSTTKCILV